MRILIGSPVRQEAEILSEFLTSLRELNADGIELHYYFIDDNEDIKSKKILRDFKSSVENVIIEDSSNFFAENNIKYVCTESNHIWKKELIERITDFKNKIINYSSEKDFDYLFFIDSDIVLTPCTLKHLLSRKLDIVSNVFWTQFVNGGPLVPQVWLQDESNCYLRDWDNELTLSLKKQKNANFINQLKIPGIYKVGGLGACTLISSKAIKKGVNFSLIENLSFWGEDRHFCVRAKALGLELYVDTVYPAYHIYRKSYLAGVEKFKKFGYDPNDFIYNPLENKKIKRRLDKTKDLISLKFQDTKNKIKQLQLAMFLKHRVTNNETITVSMIVHNEEKRYLVKVLEAAKKYTNKFVIIDDASTDGTADLCKKVLKDCELKLVINEHSLFSNEYKLRKKQWDETISTKPGWILFLDADEILEKNFKDKLPYLLKNKDLDYYSFRVYDMWNETSYREDAYWKNDTYHRFMVRYQPKYNYKFLKKKQHCGRMPANVANMNGAEYDIKVKHLGWMNEIDREKKYNRYMNLDKDGTYGNREQYESILDKNPNLVIFEEN